MNALQSLRDQLDRLDSQIVALLDERMKTVEEIGKVKQRHSLTVMDRSREESILQHVQGAAQHAALKQSIVSIYKTILTASRKVQQLYQAPPSPFRRIGIIGLGLMGGSLCRALKTKDSAIEIGTLERESEDIALAIDGRWIDKQYASLVDLMRGSELLIITSPTSTVVPLTREIGHWQEQIKSLLVMDMASVKREVGAAFEELSGGPVEYLSTHPMAGSEMSGFANSQATLFVDATWVIVPHKRNTQDGLDKIQGLIRALGAQPFFLDAERHDRQAALISHLPGILSRLFFNFVREVDPQSLEMAGPGFASFTRLAHANREMRAEIEQCNDDNIGAYTKLFVEYLRGK